MTGTIKLKEAPMYIVRNWELPAKQSASDRSHLECFMSGFYCDPGGIVYVDAGEFLRAHGVCDTPENRAALWSEIEHEFADVPLRELYDF
jgi:hypothetical protein